MACEQGRGEGVTKPHTAPPGGRPHSPALVSHVCSCDLIKEMLRALARRVAVTGAAAATATAGIAFAMRIEEDVKLDYKDVLLRPKRSTLRSRAEVMRLPRLACHLQPALSADMKLCERATAGGPESHLPIQAFEARVDRSPGGGCEYGHDRDLHHGRGDGQTRLHGGRAQALQH